MAAPFGYSAVDLSITPANKLVFIGFCKVNALYVFNHTTAIRFLQIFDLGRAPVLGVDAPTWQFGISAATAANQGAPPCSAEFTAGLKCVNGFAWAITTAAGKSASLASANDCDGAIDWELRP
jgi:hypothetical protein